MTQDILTGKLISLYQCNEYRIPMNSRRCHCGLGGSNPYGGDLTDCENTKKFTTTCGKTSRGHGNGTYYI